MVNINNDVVNITQKLMDHFNTLSNEGRKLFYDYLTRNLIFDDCNTIDTNSNDDSEYSISANGNEDKV